MTTPNLFFPDTRPQKAEGETRNMERRTPRSAAGASHSQDEFASLVDRALDAEPAKAPSSPKPQENRKPGNAADIGAGGGTDPV